MLQDEYFVVERENNDNYPIFSWDQKSSVVKQNTTKPFNVGEPLKLRLGEPIPPNPEYTDFHTTEYRRYKPPFWPSSEASCPKSPHLFTIQVPIFAV